MGLNLSTVHQRPYLAKDAQDFIKRKKDEENSKSAAHAEQEERILQNEKRQSPRYTQSASDEFTPMPQSWQNVTYTQPNYYAGAPRNVAPPVPGFNPNPATINIAQIIKDFKNTAIAIGTPKELREEVNGYIELIEKQVTKEQPNVKLIKSNLKNASTILDNYISQTLDKESKVVENWVDALFMQHINFKYNEEEVNPQFLVKFPEGTVEKKSAAEETNKEIVSQEYVEESNFVNEKIQPTDNETKVFIPQDEELKSLFIKSKKLAYAKEPKKAIENFQKALNRANEIGDTETKSKIYFEIGKIYDDYDYPAHALKCYHKSIQNTSDKNVKTRAYYSMAQIYDDVNQIEPALEHYFVSIGYGGEVDNKAAQSASLARMGNIYSDMYEEGAFEFLTIARDLAEDTENSKVKGFVSSSLGRAYERFGEPQEALKAYSEAVKNYSKADSQVKTAQNYLKAADIMLDFDSNNKARSLLNKAKHYANEANEEALLNEINDRLKQIA